MVEPASSAPVRMEVEDDVDPLDAFMAGNSVQLVKDDVDGRVEQSHTVCWQRMVLILSCLMDGWNGLNTSSWKRMMLLLSWFQYGWNRSHKRAKFRARALRSGSRPHRDRGRRPPETR